MSGKDISPKTSPEIHKPKPPTEKQLGWLRFTLVSGESLCVKSHNIAAMASTKEASDGAKTVIYVDNQDVRFAIKESLSEVMKRLMEYYW